MIILSFFLLFTASIVAVLLPKTNTEWDYINIRLIRRFEKLKHITNDIHTNNTSSTSSSSSSSSSFDRGYVLCAANFMIPDLIRTLYELRFTWNSKLPIIINHCEEINEQNYPLIQHFQPITIINLCPVGKKQIMNMDRDFAVKRLRGFFCKVASIINSPFKETMYMDIDTIWVCDIYILCLVIVSKVLYSLMIA